MRGSLGLVGLATAALATGMLAPRGALADPSPGAAATAPVGPLAVAPPADAGPFPGPQRSSSIPAVRRVDGDDYADYEGVAGFHFDLPLELPYDPEIGIPPGYRLSSRPHRRTVIAAGATLASLWGVSWVVAGFTTSSNGSNSGPLVMFVPVIGPFVAIDTWGSNNLGVNTVFFMDGLVQAVCAALLVKELAVGEKTVKYDPGLPGVKIRPMAGASPEGWRAGITGSF